MPTTHLKFVFIMIPDKTGLENAQANEGTIIIPA